MTEITKPNRKLNVPDFKPAEYERAEWVVTPEIGTTIEEMLRPEYWANVANRLGAWHRIEVRAYDAAWTADLLVRVVQPFAVKVHLVRHIEFDRPQESAAPAAVPAGYDIKARGRDGWSVVRLSDTKVLREREATRGHALAWLEAHLKVLAP